MGSAQTRLVPEASDDVPEDHRRCDACGKAIHRNRWGQHRKDCGGVFGE